MNQTKLRLSLLGGLAITENETAVSNFASRKADALLAYLVCNSRPHPRESLATLLWPNNDQTRALANLSVALTSLRKQLEPYILAERHTIGFNTEADFWLDTAVFQQAIHQARETQKRRGKLGRASAAQLATAVSLYKGDFLAGFTIRGAPEFEAWALLEQERLRLMLLTALADLVTFYQQRQQLDVGIRYAQQLLSVESLQEEAHRQLMILYAQNNQRTAALAQYEQCAAILAEELGVEPDEETTALYEQIKNDKVKEATWTVAPLNAQSPKHNLPTAVTTFIGREDELARIKQWLEDPNGRLLTIIGPGGMGKTRLAQEAARATVGQFADGVWVVSLVPYTDMDGMITAVAKAINFPFSGTGEPAPQLLEQLQSQEMLIVLDNMEHLLTPELLTFISQLSERAPDLRLIATSRERLRLQAETLLNLRGLPFPNSNNQTEPTTDYPAVQLFTNRVQRVQANFNGEKEETTVIQLCQLVGGLPLALELAATWTRILSVTEIVTEIQRGLDTLTTTLHDLPQRHRSIRAVIEASWQMLSSDEQALFRQLSVFRGGFTREAAQEVASANLPQLMSLVDRSFLRRDADQRFRRHPLLLQFSQEQLAAHPTEQTQTQTAHAYFFAAFIQAHEPALRGENTSVALTAISIDLENIQTAWEWTLQQVSLDLINQIVPTWYAYFNQTSQFARGFSLFTAAVDQLATIEFDNEAIIQLHCAFGSFAYQTGNNRLAAKELGKCVAAARQLQHKNLTALTLYRLGINSGYQGNQEESKRCLEEAIQIAEQVHDLFLLSGALNSLAIAEWTMGELDSAEQHASRSLQLAGELGQKTSAAIRRVTLGTIAHHKKEHDRAIPYFEEAYRYFVSIDHRRGIGITLFNLANTWGALGDHQRALEIKIEASKLDTESGDVWGKAVDHISIADTLIELNRIDEAEKEARIGVQLAGTELPKESVYGLGMLGRCAAYRGRLADAASLLAFALAHPTIENHLVEGLQELLDSLQVEMPPPLFEQAVAVAADWTLDGVIQKLLQS